MAATLPFAASLVITYALPAVAEPQRTGNFSSRRAAARSGNCSTAQVRP
ncbi:hypothetical protein [Streptomyces sp. NPDC020607]